MNSLRLCFIEPRRKTRTGRLELLQAALGGGLWGRSLREVQDITRTRRSGEKDCGTKTKVEANSHGDGAELFSAASQELSQQSARCSVWLQQQIPRFDQRRCVEALHADDAIARIRNRLKARRNITR